MIAHTFYQFDGDPADERAWQAFVAANSESFPVDQPQHSSATRSLTAIYESFLIFTILVAFVGVMLWQRSTTRMAGLEAQVQTLAAQLAAAERASEQAAIAKDVQSQPQAKTVRHIVERDVLRFVVESANLPAIIPLTAKVDEAYRRLCEDLALDPLANGEKRTIYVTDQVNSDSAELFTALDMIVVVAAPQTYPALDVEGAITASAIPGRELTEQIYNDLYQQLARKALADAIAARRIKLVWNVFIGHLTQQVARNQPLKTAAVALTSNVEVSHVAQTLSPAVVEVKYEPGNWMYGDNTWAHTVAEPLVAYILATYGRASIPPLLDALSVYDSWDEIPPVVFGISADQFEAEWHVYLQEHYPLDPADQQ